MRGCDRVVIGVLSFIGAGAVVAIVWIKERRRIAASRHAAWADIGRDAPDGTAMTTIEPDAVARIEIGRSAIQQSESHGDR